MGRIVTGLYYDEEAQCWKATGGERHHGRRASVTHEWTDEERTLVALTLRADGSYDRAIQKRVIAVLPKDVPISSVHLMRANLRGALDIGGGFKNPDSRVVMLAKRGLERLHAEGESELLKRETTP